MARRLISALLVALVLLPSCRCGSKATDGGAPEARSQSADVDPCVLAIDASAAAHAQGWISAREHGIQPSSRDADVASTLACAKLYRRMPCRRAHEEMTVSSRPPSARFEALASACADAYCRDLAPSPVLCTDRDAAAGRPPSEWRPMVEELEDGILRYELGPASARVFDAKKRAEARIRAALDAYLDAGSPSYEVRERASDAATPP